MHSTLFFLLAFAVSPAAAAKVLAIAGGVYAILQVVKKIFPSLTGWYALALNFALSALGFLVTIPTDQLLSINTLVGLLTAVAASAGIHGTVKNLGPSSSPAPAEK